LKKIAISFINRKGGVGKTTLAIIFAQTALSAGLKVAAVDLDSQKNFTDAMSLVQERYGNNLHITDKITEDGDVIILDCPPALCNATDQAFSFSDITLIPVRPDMFSLSNIDVVYNNGKAHGKAFQQMAIVKVGFTNKIKGLSGITTMALSLREYAIAGDIAINGLIPFNIASGRIWSASITVPTRMPYLNMYQRVINAYNMMLDGNYINAWEDNTNAKT